MKILFVDDEDNIRELFQEYFASDFEIKLASDGMEALDLATTEFFDLIISDISLPKLNGIQFVKKLRMAGFFTPFIVITGDSDIQLAIDVFRMGAVDFFLKPFRMEALRQRIQAYEYSDQDTAGLFLNGEVAYGNSELNVQFRPKIKNLGKYIAVVIDHIKCNPLAKPDALLSIKVSLYELLANAIEHGTAGITYREKQAILESSADYFQYVDDLSLKSMKIIRISIKINEVGIILEIEDEGTGFKLVEIPSPLSDPGANLVNGRGIFLVRMNVDSLEFNEKGNVVTILKKWT